MPLRAHLNEPASREPSGAGTRSTKRWIFFLVALATGVGALAGTYVWWGLTLPIGRRAANLVPEAAAVVIFAMTYLVVPLGRLPGSRLARAGAALVGASLMVAAGALPLEDAPKA